MFEHMNETQAKQQILDMVAEYCDTYHKKAAYKEGDRIPYASRVYDHEEMCNLVDSACIYGTYFSITWRTPGKTWR